MPLKNVRKSLKNISRLCKHYKHISSVFKLLYHLGTYIFVFSLGTPSLCIAFGVGETDLIKWKRSYGPEECSEKFSLQYSRRSIESRGKACENAGVKSWWNSRRDPSLCDSNARDIAGPISLRQFRTRRGNTSILATRRRWLRRHNCFAGYAITSDRQSTMSSRSYNEERTI